MPRKPLTLAQSRFLGDQLKLQDFEYLLTHSPLRFLQDFVCGFKLNIPFSTVHLASHLQQTGKFPTLSLAEAQSEVYAGRGGSCLLNNPFADDFLRSLGFRSHIIAGFNASRSFRRDVFHCAVVVRDVEQKGDVFHVDVGASLPFMGVTNLTSLLDTGGVGAQESGGDAGGSSKILASPILQSLQLNYQIIKSKHLASAFGEPGDVNSRNNLGQPPRRFSSYVNLDRLQADLLEDEDEGSLVLAIAKDDVVGVSIRQLAPEPTGDWLPFHVFPTPLHSFDFNIARSIFGSPEVMAWMKIGIGAARGVHISGFGQKSGEFLLINNDRCVKCKGSAAAATSLSSSPLSADSTPAPFSLETTTLESEEEVLTLVEEEFPLLLRDSRDTMELLRKVDSMSDFSTLPSDAFEARLQNLN